MFVPFPVSHALRKTTQPASSALPSSLFCIQSLSIQSLSILFSTLLPGTLLGDSRRNVKTLISDLVWILARLETPIQTSDGPRARGTNHETISSRSSINGKGATFQLITEISSLCICYSFYATCCSYHLAFDEILS
jgi:hypothetical protein